ncbi:mitochondrial carrier domain-containing protein [Obelidium mucronatum]|nr:mitochondrial carrier domain-containing protein [Obelidium mucronatum]
MVNWLTPIVITLSDVVALWELSPDTNHATAHLQSSLGLPPVSEPRASILTTPSQPLDRWRDPNYHPASDHVGSNRKQTAVVQVQLTALDKKSSDLVALVTAAIASRTATAPLERVKVMLQTGAFSEPVAGLKKGEKPLRLGLGMVFRLLIKLDGVRLGFYRGNGINALRAIPVALTQFGSYNLFRRILTDHEHMIMLAHPLNVAVAAGLAGIVSVTLTHPLEVLRTRISLILTLKISTAKLRPSASILDTAKDIMAKEGGIRGLYRGLGLSLFGIVPYLSTSFVLYDTLKPHTANNELSWEGVATASASAGIAQAVTYPFDLLRRRVMTEGLYVRDHNLTRGRSAFRIMRDIIRLEGAAGAFRGLLPNLLKVAPATGVTLYIHDQWRNAL